MRRMELGPLRSFLEVARQGHVTRAARRLHLTQPAVSNHLARLEDELGLSLFHRTPQGMVLTDAGRLFRPFAEAAFLSLDDGQRQLARLAGLERGNLSVGGGATATTYLLPDLLRRFHEEHPGIRLYVREQGSCGVLAAVRAGILDLGIVTLPVAATGLVVVPWVEDSLQLVVPAGHPLEGRSSFEWSDLAGVPLVLFEADTAVRQLIDAALQAAGVNPVIVMELRSIESIKQMVAQGIGAAFVSRFAITQGLPTISPPGEGLTRTLALVWRAERPPSLAAQAFLDLATET
ncbi:MAG: DNA-binding transcriptional LysR family regulator [Myxococcota bacterium]|jgi:DNA-binding transcriptional LysR family regulator